jgi:hypothetical protein
MDTFLELAAAEEVPRWSVDNYQQLLPFPAFSPARRGAESMLFESLSDVLLPRPKKQLLMPDIPRRQNGECSPTAPSLSYNLWAAHLIFGGAKCPGSYLGATQQLDSS